MIAETTMKSPELIATEIVNCFSWTSNVQRKGRMISQSIAVAELIAEAIEIEHAEIARLQEAKRRALAVADERSKENVALRAALIEAGDYVAVCPVPAALETQARAELNEKRGRIAQAAHAAREALGK